MKKVLAVNSGSSSFKYKLFSLDNEEVIASGMADRVGLPGSVFTMTLADGSQHDEESDIANQEEAVQKLLSWLKEYKVIDSLADIVGVGHRVVAGEKNFLIVQLLLKIISGRFITCVTMHLYIIQLKQMVSMLS